MLFPQFNFQEREKLIVYLVDTGKRIEIPYDLEKFYSLPKEIQDMESFAVPCKVIEVSGILYFITVGKGIFPIDCAFTDHRWKWYIFGC